MLKIQFTNLNNHTSFSSAFEDHQLIENLTNKFSEQGAYIGEPIERAAKRYRTIYTRNLIKVVTQKILVTVNILPIHSTFTLHDILSFLALFNLLPQQITIYDRSCIGKALCAITSTTNYQDVRRELSLLGLNRQVHSIITNVITNTQTTNNDGILYTKISDQIIEYDFSTI